MLLHLYSDHAVAPQKIIAEWHTPFSMWAARVLGLAPRGARDIETATLEGSNKHDRELSQSSRVRHQRQLRSTIKCHPTLLGKVRPTGRKLASLFAVPCLLCPWHKVPSHLPFWPFTTVSPVDSFGVWFYFQYDFIVITSFRKSLFIATVSKNLLTAFSMTIRWHSTSKSFQQRCVLQPESLNIW